jgi:hypothetical protein
MGSARSRVLAVATGAAVIMGMGGGVAVARDMVSGDEISNHTITGRDMERNSVGPFQIRPEGVRGHQLADGTVRWRDLAAWVQDRVRSAGEDGAEGPKGEPGDDGQDGVSGLETDGFYTRNDGGGLGPAVQPGEVKQLTTTCAEGKYVLSGGFGNGNSTPGHDLIIRESHPSGFEAIEGDPQGSVRATSWSVTFENETDTAQHAQVFVTCAEIGDAAESE